MDRGTRFFWLLVMVLVGASVYFGVNAEARRRSVQKSEASVATGDVVRFVRTIDGDTLLVENQGGESVALRLLGIKAFAAGTDKDPASRFGQAAIDELTSLAEDKPLRVLLNDPPTDKHGRMLVELFVADQDVGLQLVRRGLVLVYTVYPFPSMALYLQEQEAARAKRLGIWGDAEVARRADLQLEQWRREAR